jgi:hypothetical protein
MSATVDIRALFAQLKNKKAIITGCFLQFVVLPLLGFIVVKSLDMNETMGVSYGLKSRIPLNAIIISILTSYFFIQNPDNIISRNIFPWRILFKLVVQLV